MCYANSKFKRVVTIPISNKTAFKRSITTDTEIFIRGEKQHAHITIIEVYIPSNTASNDTIKHLDSTDN